MAGSEHRGQGGQSASRTVAGMPPGVGGLPPHLIPTSLWGVAGGPEGLPAGLVQTSNFTPVDQRTGLQRDPQTGYVPPYSPGYVGGLPIGVPIYSDRNSHPAGSGNLTPANTPVDHALMAARARALLRG